MVLDPLNTAWAQICLLHLVTERGSAEVKHFLPSLGKHGVERRGSGTNTWIYSAEGPFGCLLTCPPLVCSCRDRRPLPHTSVTPLHITVAVASKAPHRSILQEELQDFVTNSVVLCNFSRFPNFFGIRNPNPVVLTNTIR